MRFKLEDCPFCGSGVYIKREPLWQERGNSIHGYRGCYEYIIECSNPECRCSVYLGNNDTIYRSDEEAINEAVTHWNRRAKPYERSKNGEDTVL